MQLRECTTRQINNIIQATAKYFNLKFALYIVEILGCASECLYFEMDLLISRPSQSNCG